MKGKKSATHLRMKNGVKTLSMGIVCFLDGMKYIAAKTEKSSVVVIVSPLEFARLSIRSVLIIIRTTYTTYNRQKFILSKKWERSKKHAKLTHSDVYYHKPHKNSLDIQETEVTTLRCMSGVSSVFSCES